MGHIHLATLPKTKPWRAVVALLDDGAPEHEVIAASAIAAERELERAAGDATFVEAVRLLGLIPHAAKSPAFGAELRALGLDVPDEPHLADILVAAGRRLDERAGVAGRTDFGELSRRALVGTLSREIGAHLPGLLAPGATDVRLATARIGRPEYFARTARALFGRLTADTLSAWLDRKLSAHVGPGRRFAHVGERAAFDAALSQYCAEATRIIREFARGWYGKTIFREGTITSERAAGFAAIAFRKIGEELRRKRAPDD